MSTYQCLFFRCIVYELSLLREHADCTDFGARVQVQHDAREELGN